MPKQTVCFDVGEDQQSEGYIRVAKYAPVPSVVAEYSYSISRHLSWHTCCAYLRGTNTQPSNREVSSQSLRYITGYLYGGEGDGWKTTEASNDE